MVLGSPARCCLLLIWALAAGCAPQQERAASAPDDATRQDVKRFWQAYGEATRLRMAGRTDDAVSRYYDALRVDPTHEDSRYYLASCLVKLGEHKRAVEVYEELVRLNPASHRGHFQLGLSASTPEPGAALDFRLARRSFERNLAINREESGPFLRLGDLALFEGNLPEARQHYDVAAGFQSPEGLFRAGFVRYAAGEYGQAAALFGRVLEQNEHERKISGRGVHSEGDIRTSSGQLTPLERAGIQSLIYLYWSTRRLGGYPAAVPQHSRLAPRPASGLRFEPWKPPAGISAQVPSVGDLWDGDWRPLPYEKTARGAAILQGFQVPAAEGRRPIVDAAAADFDGDGRRDVLLLWWKGGLTVHRATALGGFEDRSAGSGLPGPGVESFALAVLDFDRDQKPDILLAPYAPYPEALANLARAPAGPSTFGLQLYRNLGGARFQREELPGLSETKGAVSAVPADFDRDGFPDLLLACGGLDGVRLEPSLVLRNEKGQAFRPAAWLPGFDEPVRALGAAAADYDGDGRIDVCIRTAGKLMYFRNAR